MLAMSLKAGSQDVAAGEKSGDPTESEGGPVLLPPLEDEPPLDRAQFEHSLSVWALRLPARHVSAAQALLRDRVLRRPHLKPVLADETDPAFRVLLLAPDAESEVRDPPRP